MIPLGVAFGMTVGVGLVALAVGVVLGLEVARRGDGPEEWLGDDADGVDGCYGRREPFGADSAPSREVGHE